MKNGWTAAHYALFRRALGLYLLVHFGALLPWGGEVFSSAGALPSAAAGPLWGLLPNVLALSDAPAAVAAVLGLAAALALLLAAGIADGPAAIGLWYLHACLLGRNPLILNPSLPYVGWLLLAHGLLLARRPSPRAPWRMPPELFAAAWIVLAVGYTYSGAAKLESPSWVHGEALRRVLENPLARPGAARELLLGLPDWSLRGATWGALALELGFAPLALSSRLRPWLWAAMTAMHLSLLVLIDFADLTAGMLLAHAFTFDPAWLGPWAGSGAPAGRRRAAQPASFL